LRKKLRWQQKRGKWKKLKRLDKHRNAFSRYSLSETRCFGNCKFITLRILLFSRYLFNINARFINLPALNIYVF
jgi:hypothetical protein